MNASPGKHLKRYFSKVFLKDCIVKMRGQINLVACIIFLHLTFSPSGNHSIQYFTFALPCTHSYPPLLVLMGCKLPLKLRLHKVT